MKKIQILFLAILSIFLISNVSAITVSGSWSDGSKDLTITDGQSPSFTATLGSANPPMTINVKLYDSQNNLLHPFESNTRDNSYLFEDSYTVVGSGNNKMYAGPGSYSVKIIGSASDGSSKTVTLNLQVNAAGTPGNNAPVITAISDQNIDEGQTFTYNVVATDADGDTLAYTMSGAPTGFSISSTGAISGTAPTVLVDTPYTITVSVDDGNGGTDTEVFDLTILDSSSSDATAPTVTITSPKNTIYDSHRTQIIYTATDANLDECWYSKDGGLTNSTHDNTCSGTFSITSVEGINKWTVYASDTADNIESATVTFIINLDENGDNKNNKKVEYSFEDPDSALFAGGFVPERKVPIDLSSEATAEKSGFFTRLILAIAKFIKSVFEFVF